MANIRFAKTIEPENLALVAREAAVAAQLAEGRPTIPSSIGEEKAANPFLRADVPDVAQAVGMAGAPAAEVFAEIRTRKNRF
jgi:hydroxyacylglutathione hydrolase